MNVIINGEKIELKNSSTVANMVEERQIKGTMFVVEKNLEIVNKEDYVKTPIEENDKIEIVGFFGGG